MVPELFLSPEILDSFNNIGNSQRLSLFHRIHQQKNKFLNQPEYFDDKLSKRVFSHCDKTQT